MEKVKKTKLTEEDVKEHMQNIDPSGVVYGITKSANEKMTKRFRELLELEKRFRKTFGEEE